MSRPIVFAALAGSLLGCGSGGGGSGNRDTPTGNFTWTEGTTTFRAGGASYMLGATLDGQSFLIDVMAVAPPGATCILSGHFAAAVPPAPGTYPVAPVFAGTQELPVPDASFTFLCQPGTIRVFVNDPSLDGEVILSRSVVGDVRGSFTFDAATGPAADAPNTTFTGEFSLPCDSSGRAPCGPLSSAGAGTCADLLACCGRATPDLVGGCMNVHGMVSPNGDVACGRALAAQKSTYCP